MRLRNQVDPIVKGQEFPGVKDVADKSQIKKVVNGVATTRDSHHQDQG